MADPTFASLVTAQARVVARLEVKRRKLRKSLDEADQLYREAQRQLKLLVSTVEPFTPPTAAEVASARERSDELPG